MCVFIGRLLCVCVGLFGWDGGPDQITQTREEEESWTPAQHVLNASFQIAYVRTACVVYAYICPRFCPRVCGIESMDVQTVISGSF